MMADILDLGGKKISSMELPAVFDTDYRPDVIHRAVISLESHHFQPKGNFPEAGKGTTAVTWGKNHGMSRCPRIKGGPRRQGDNVIGFQSRGKPHPLGGAGAFAPFCYHGHRCHPPRPEKILTEGMNRKERRLAIRSAIAATANKELVLGRGHIYDGALPLVVDDKLHDLKKTKEVLDVFMNLKLGNDLMRAKDGIKIKAGRGKTRGRKYRRPVAPLIVTARDSNIELAARNLAGVSVTKVQNLNAYDLAPGTHAGRLVVWTKSAIDELGKGLFR